MRLAANVNVYIRKGAQHRVESGHPWVYQSEIDYVDGQFQPGDIVDVYNFRQRFIGRGYINPRSQITVRILSREQEDINRNFFKKRIETAWRYRQTFIAEPEYCRLIFGEADFLPALIVDKFGQYMVMQTLALGIEVHKDTIVSVLEELFDPAGIYERNDVPVRKLEGLEMRKGYIKGKFPTLITVKENGIPFYADIENGQKTGFFYDQRENRLFLKYMVPEAEVLDCFCHTGSFAIHSALFGAKSVHSIDISEDAICLAQKNAALNKVDDRCRFEVANAFDALRTLTGERRQYDVVILDPPAFTKSRDSIEGAVRGYKEINLRGLKLVRPGGYLITCSCSYHMDRELFKAVVVDAARDAKRVIREVEYRTQAKDHPILPAAGETNYLKFLVIQVQ
ncbi:MAG TPA: class I SAM-dependent rRNA methyltransferase [Methylomusa anaerophila]|uniref:Ribosomal RNA large subunit methyltransferase I n=1 Tax=Methylomusa anaerophila TaxID=1930071 RepID=A0A348AJR7_9FIRM|nr:class I SAM-dependent rRNA methyltransferase [Methylomusa anaerophila]BBB91315.1 ribosomal RNA large subunit methyltransferase I [Methylomusa anaerophila]HML90510.1 class I SAM-dependent rRNA methyltransferase [Methylomusa anaerophila]